MVAMKPRVVIIGAGMAGLVAAHKLYKANSNNQLFELCIVEGGTRIGGRIQTTEFCGNKVEMGATWIHGIGGSPIHKIAQEINSLESDQPWERMDGFPDDHPLTVFENGLVLDSSIVEPISNLYKNLMDFAQGKLIEENDNNEVDYVGIANKAFKICTRNEKEQENISIGSFLRRGLDTYWVEKNENLNRKSIEKAVFGIYENTERTYTSAGDLFNLDFNAESEYKEFPDEEITIAKGYSSVIESLASVLPAGLIRFEKKVLKIEWKPEEVQVQSSKVQNLDGTKPVKLHFEDGSIMETDHVIVTVSLGVLKAGVQENSGEEALELECLKDEEIINGVTTTVSNFLKPIEEIDNSEKWSNGYVNSVEKKRSNNGFKFTSVLKSGWGTDPLFMGSYSYVAVGSSGDDLDVMAKPLPCLTNDDLAPLQILFAGEATHRTHYSTTHGAYFSGVREANRLLKHYNCDGFSGLLHH